MGIILAICLGIALYALDMAHGHMGTENVTIMVVTLLGVVAFGGWLTILTAGGYLGATTLREDGLLIAKPWRGSQLLTWGEINKLKVGVFAAGKGASVLGLCAVVSGKTVFLPGILTGGGPKDPKFDERIRVIESAWQRARPGLASPEDHSS